MTGKQFIHFIAKLRGMNDYTHAEELMHFFELDASGLIKNVERYEAEGWFSLCLHASSRNCHSR